MKNESLCVVFVVVVGVDILFAFIRYSSCWDYDAEKFVSERSMPHPILLTR